MDETKEISIDLRKIIYMMRNKLVYILIATVLLAAASGCFTEFFIKPVYSSTVSMYVYNNADRITSSTYTSGSDIVASMDLMGTYVEILQSNTVLEEVQKDLNLNISLSALKSMVKPTIKENTQIFYVTVKSTDSQLAADIANSIAKVAPAEIVRIVKAGGVEIVDEAVVAKTPSSPNKKKNILIGAVAGFVLSFLAIFVYELFDSTITKATDLERDFDIPVLGTIPKLEATEAPKDNDKQSKSTAAVGAKPSNKVLENLQSMKGEAKND